MNQQITYNGLVGFELERIRKELGKEQSEISISTGISQPVLSRLEKGKAMITIDQLFVVCAALGVKPEDIISKASKGVDAFDKEDAVNVTTTKEANTAGAVLTGAAIGALLTLLLSKSK
jgi:transcriptional regulator with XRE-family HTH domain